MLTDQMLDQSIHEDSGGLVRHRNADRIAAIEICNGQYVRISRRCGSERATIVNADSVKRSSGADILRGPGFRSGCLSPPTTEA